MTLSMDPSVPSTLYTGLFLLSLIHLIIPASFTQALWDLSPSP
jgi:hypothetical protein